MDGSNSTLVDSYHLSYPIGSNRFRLFKILVQFTVESSHSIPSVEITSDSKETAYLKTLKMSYEPGSSTSCTVSL